MRINRVAFWSAFVLFSLVTHRDDGVFAAGTKSPVNWQGRITDAGGLPIIGLVNLKFRLFRDSTGGTALDSFSTVANADPQGYVVVGGIDLGFPVGPPPPLPGLHDSLPEWMELVVNGTAMSLRTRLNPARHSISAEALRGGLVQTNGAWLGIYSDSTLASRPGVVLKKTNDSSSAYVGNLSGLEPGWHTIWTATGGVTMTLTSLLGDTAISARSEASDQTFGINTGHPTEALTVAGAGRYYSGLANAGTDPWTRNWKGIVLAKESADEWGRSSGDSAGIFLPSDVNDFSIISSRVSGGKTALRMSVGDDPNDHIFLMPSGNVGIGDTVPSQKLTVKGTVYSTTGGFKFPDGTVQATAAGAVPSGPWYTSGSFIFTDSLSTVSVGINTDSPNSPLHVNGPVATVVSTSSLSTTLGSGHSVFLASTVFPFSQTVTLPTAVGVSGREYTIKRTSSGSVTVATTGGQTIDGAATFSLSAQWKYVVVVSNGSNWMIVGNN